MVTTLLVLVFTVLVLPGCLTAQLIMLTSGPPVALHRLTSGTEVVLGACDTMLSRTCERVEKTDDPRDEEAWSFGVQIDINTTHFTLQRMKVGTAPMTVYVLGPKETCVAIYETWPHQNSPCEGPAYFRRG